MPYLALLALIAIASNNSNRKAAAGRQRRKLRRAQLRQLAGALYRRTADLLGVAAPRLMADSTVENAQSNGAYIYINLDWLESQLCTACSDIRCTAAVIVGTFAHELAHHFHGDVFSSEHPHVHELRADYWAGVALARLGLSLDDFEAVIIQLSARETDTHPAAHARSAWMRSGYNDELIRNATQSVWKPYFVPA